MKLFLCLCHPQVSKKTLFFSGCPSIRRVRSFSRPIRSRYHDISWMAWAISMKLIRNIQWPFNDDLISFQRSKIEGQGHRRPWSWRRRPSSRLIKKLLFSTDYFITQVFEVVAMWQPDCHQSVICPFYQWRHESRKQRHLSTRRWDVRQPLPAPVALGRCWQMS